MAEGINLALLPPLDVVKQVDHEAIIADVVERAGLENASPSDPAFRVTLANTYREVLLRQDAIGATYYQHPDGTPVQRLDGESNDDYRARLQKSPEGLSVAGPDGAYEYHAQSAHPDVKGVAVDSPAPVEVVLSILSHSGTGEPSQSVLDAVTAYIEPFRPMTDQVSVVGATVLSYSVVAALYIKHGPDPELVRKTAEDRLLAYVNEQHRLKGRVVESGIHAALTLEGVEEVRLTNWNDVICTKQQAPFCSGVTVTIGGLV